MPELPEIRTLAEQMDRELAGSRITAVEVDQEKCLNRSVDSVRRGLVGRTLGPFEAHGKWIRSPLAEGEALAINLGMGAEVRLPRCAEEPPENYKFRMHTANGGGLFIRFWWFGHVHLLDGTGGESPMDRLGIDALDPALDCGAFRALLAGRRGGIKSFLLNQKNIAGIGNFYAHDLLARSGIHPMRPIPSLEPGEIGCLYRTMRDLLEASVALGGADYERDLYGRPGGFSRRRFIVGYREGEPCGRCGETVVKIRTGSTPGFICPDCQPENPTGG